MLRQTVIGHAEPLHVLRKSYCLNSSIFDGVGGTQTRLRGGCSRQKICPQKPWSLSKFREGLVREMIDSINEQVDSPCGPCAYFRCKVAIARKSPRSGKSKPTAVRMKIGPVIAQGFSEPD